MTINTFDAIMQVGQSTNTSSTQSSDSNSGSSSEFESLLNQESTGSSDQTVSAETGSATTGGTTTEQSDLDTDVTEYQQQLMAALIMPTIAYQVVEVADVTPEVAMASSEVVQGVEIVNLVDNQNLNLGEEGLAQDLTPDLEQNTGDQLFDEDTAVLEMEGQFKLDDVTLEEVPVMVENFDAETVVEVETEILPETVDVEVEDSGANLGGQTDTENQSGDVKVKSTDDSELNVEGQDVKLFQKVEHAPVKVAETVHTQAPDMDEQMATIIETAVEDGDSTITIQLTPESLGTITVELTRTADGLLQVVLQATDKAATALLSDHASTIAQALQGSNNSVTVQVETAEADTANQEFDHEGQSQQQEQGHERQNSGEEESYDGDFMHQLRLGLVSMEEN